MSDTRPLMIGSAALFLALASVAEVALFYPLGGLSDAVAARPPVLIHVLAGCLAFAGILLIVFAPPSRRKERRVRLERPAVEEQVIAPKPKTTIPTTRGMGEAKNQPQPTTRGMGEAKNQPQPATREMGEAKNKPQPAPKPTRPPPETSAGPEDRAKARPADEQTSGQDPPAPPEGSTAPTARPPAQRARPPAEGTPPERQAPDAEPAPAPTRTPRPPPNPAATEETKPEQSPRPPRPRGTLAGDIGERRVRRVDENSATTHTVTEEADTSDPSDPVAMAERLEHLDRQANQLKVQFALGKLSPRGYRHMLETIDGERSRLEARLVEHQRFD